MKKAALVLMAALTVSVPAAMASSTTCPTGALTAYLAANFSCTSGNLVFSNFAYIGTASPTGDAIPASGVSVTPTTITGNEGFSISSGWSIFTGGASDFVDSKISFVVTSANHLATLDDLDLSFNGSFGGTGVSKVTETYCKNATTVTGCASGGTIQVTNPPGKPFDSVTFIAPVSSLAISEDVNVSAGSNGNAMVSNFNARISQVSGVPEPMSYVLFGTGLVGLGLLRRQAKKS